MASDEDVEERLRRLEAPAQGIPPSGLRRRVVQADSISIG